MLHESRLDGGTDGEFFDDFYFGKVVVLTKHRLRGKKQERKNQVVGEATYHWIEKKWQDKGITQVADIMLEGSVDSEGAESAPTADGFE